MPATGGARPGSRWARALRAAGVAGPTLFVAVFLVESVFHPVGYSPTRLTVSAFVLGPYGGVQVANFLAGGGLVVASAVGLPAVLRRHQLGGRGVAVLVGLVGLGLAVAGLFPADPVAAGATAASPYPLGVPWNPGRTGHGIAHDLAGTPVFLGLPAAAAIVGYHAARTGRRAWAVYCLVSAVVFLALFVLTSTALAQPPLLPPVGGLLQRLTLITGLGWLAALAVRARR